MHACARFIWHGGHAFALTQRGECATGPGNRCYGSITCRGVFSFSAVHQHRCVVVTLIALLLPLPHLSISMPPINGQPKELKIPDEECNYALWTFVSCNDVSGVFLFLKCWQLVLLWGTREKERDLLNAWDACLSAWVWLGCYCQLNWMEQLDFTHCLTVGRIVTQPDRVCYSPVYRSPLLLPHCSLWKLDLFISIFLSRSTINLFTCFYSSRLSPDVGQIKPTSDTCKIYRW